MLYDKRGEKYLSAFSTKNVCFSLVAVLMYNALLKNPPFQATGDQRKMNGTKCMGYIGPLGLWKLSLSKMRSKNGVNGNLNFHVWLFWFVLGG